MTIPLPSEKDIGHMLGKPRESMVERVARAICGEDPDRVGPVTCDDGRRVAPGQPAWTAWADDARKAIAAMREPTNSMEEAGEEAVYSCYSLEPGEGFDENPGPTAWRAMIDAALADP